MNDKLYDTIHEISEAMNEFSETLFLATTDKFLVTRRDRELYDSYLQLYYLVSGHLHRLYLEAAKGEWDQFSD